MAIEDDLTKLEDQVTIIAEGYAELLNEKKSEIIQLVTSFDESGRKDTFDVMPPSALLYVLEHWPCDLVVPYLWSLDKLKMTGLLDELSPAVQNKLKTYQGGQDKSVLNQDPKEDETGLTVKPISDDDDDGGQKKEDEDTSSESDGGYSGSEYIDSAGIGNVNKGDSSSEEEYSSSGEEFSSSGEE
jgi:hypothetical protein